MLAVEYGAFQYLSKPVSPQKLWETVVRASRLRQLARLKEQVGDRRSEDSGLLGERAALEVSGLWACTCFGWRFNRSLPGESGEFFAYEALVRSTSPR